MLAYLKYFDEFCTQDVHAVLLNSDGLNNTDVAKANHTCNLLFKSVN